MTATSPEFRYWIDMTLECIRRDHTPSVSAGDQKGPFLTARAQAMALSALHDASALASGMPPLVNIDDVPALLGENGVVAGAAACLSVLALRYPKQSSLLASAWADWLLLNGTADNTSAEIAGRAYGAAVHGFGSDDVKFAILDAYMPSAAPYTHDRPTNEPMQHFSGGKWGHATPLVVPVIRGFAPPPGRTDATTVQPTAHFQSDFNAVVGKGVGDRLSGTRSLEEEVIGIYWGYDGPPQLGTPPRLYMQIALKVLDDLEAADRAKLGPSEELKIIAAIAIAMADAGISCWHYKYSDDHMMWRPVVGIQLAAGDNGNPVPGWLPLGRPDTNGMGHNLTPDFPAYPSGHATFGASAFQLLRLFLAEKGAANFDANGTDDIEFSFMSDEFNGRNTDPRTGAPRQPITRGFSSLWSAIVENSISRGYLGVHWFFDGVTINRAGNDDFGFPVSPNELGKIGGVYLGAQIANTLARLIGVSQNTILSSKMAI